MATVRKWLIGSALWAFFITASASPAQTIPEINLFTADNGSSFLEWPAWKNEPRWEIGLQLTSENFPMDWEGCDACRVFAASVGATFGYRLSRFIYLDSEFNLFPGTGSVGSRVRAEEGLLGVKVGRTFHSWGLFTSVRPGFVHYEKTLIPGNATVYENVTRIAFDLGGSVEYYASRHSTLRFNVETTLIQRKPDASRQEHA